MRLVALVLALAGLVAAGSVWAKEGAVARLTTALPLDAAPGTTIRVGWTVDVPDGSGGREPFGAGGMFVRLLGRAGGPSATGLADGADGPYAATVDVPADGIGGVRAGLRGTTDVLFPLANNPFRSPGGALCDVAALRASLAAFVRAYNAGDLRRLDALFSRDRFVWYSSGGPGVRRLADAENRATLVPYFRRRHERGDRLGRLTFRFNALDRGRDLGHFALSVERRADDFRGGTWLPVSGKGALDCSKPPVTIAVLSLGAAG
jgi:hypothetical protein